MPGKKKEIKASSKSKAKKAPAKKTAAKPLKLKKTTVKKAAASKTKPATKTSKASVKTVNKTTAASAKVLTPKKASSKISPASTTYFKPLQRQGETQLVAFVRDPQCVFTYWEITPERLEEVKKELQGEFKTSFMVLRLYRMLSNGDRELVDEIELEPGQINRYVDLKQPEGTYVFEIAQKSLTGRVISVVTSGPIVATPIAASSPRLSAESGRDGLTEMEQMPEAMWDYYENQGYSELSENTAGLSSSEIQKRKQKAHRSSFF
jgi:hypothetical protein